MGRVYLHLALTLSGRLLTLFQHCDCVSSLQDGFEEREIMIDGPLFNLLITGDGVAIIQVPLVPWRRRPEGEERGRLCFPSPLYPPLASVA